MTFTKLTSKFEYTQPNAIPMSDYNLLTQFSDLSETEMPTSEAFSMPDPGFATGQSSSFIEETPEFSLNSDVPVQ